MTSAPGPPGSSLPPGQTTRAGPSLRVPFPRQPAVLGLPRDPPALRICHLHSKSTLSPGLYWPVATRTAGPLDHCLPNTNLSTGNRKDKSPCPVELWPSGKEGVSTTCRKWWNSTRSWGTGGVGTRSKGLDGAVAGALDTATFTCSRQDRI